MKLILAILAGLIFIFFVFLYARTLIYKFNEKIDNTAKHYGYRDYKELKKVGEKEEEKIIKTKIRNIRRRKYGRKV